MIDSRLGPVVRASRVYETDPVGPAEQGRYLNQVVLLWTSKAPREMLAHLLEIEADLGRSRGTRWGPRTIDLDLLLCGEQVWGGAELTVPHPRLHERSFVLVPLSEVLPDWRHPLLGRNVMEMLAGLARGGISLWEGDVPKNGS
jgi:2-amino-4-hydroxy-6-hydroxymethyldihydropteridine diphosphokinase